MDGEVKIVPVTGGRFYCESCGQAFVGTYHGDFSEALCPFCEGPLENKKDSDDESN